MLNTKTVNVTPGLARDWLTKNIQNRTVRPNLVDRFVALIESGEFQLTHQGIAFSNKDVLIDGQHRLLAIAKANRSVRMQVTYNLDPKTFIAFDDGATRNASDKLMIPKNKAEVVRAVAVLGTGHNVPTGEDLQRAYALIKAPLELLHRDSNGCAAIFSSALFRTAAVQLLMQGDCDPEYIIKMYANLVMARIADLPPVGQAMVTQVLRKSVRTNDKADLIARAFYVFSKDNQSMTRIQINDPEAAMTRAREFFRPLLKQGK